MDGLSPDTFAVVSFHYTGSYSSLFRLDVSVSSAYFTTLGYEKATENFQQEANVTFPPELVALVDGLEAELQRGELSDASRAWLAQCGLTAEQIKNQMEPGYTPQRKIHLYHCDHRGLPLALINLEGKTEWSAEYDAWGNMLREDNPHHLQQLIRLPGQQYDKETELYYNRYRYYDPLQGRYITQDPIGLLGGLNLYQYPLNPVSQIDPLGLYNLYDLMAESWRDGPEGTASVDIGVSGELISLGGSLAAGLAVGKKKGDFLSDLCAYITACGHAGLGTAASVSITGTVSDVMPSTGISQTVGVIGTGGFLGDVTVSAQTDVDNPEAVSASVGIGAGGGAFAGGMTCGTAQLCIFN